MRAQKCSRNSAVLCCAVVYSMYEGVADKNYGSVIADILYATCTASVSGQFSVHALSCSVNTAIESHVAMHSALELQRTRV
jgi:hypothetical protein